MKSLLKELLPPLVTRFIRKIILRRKDTISYQGVISPVLMRRLHKGKFSKIHEKWSSLDGHLNGNTNITRLRVYYTFSFANIAISNTSKGDILNAGISYGTSSLVVSELLKNKLKGRIFYFIDPMEGTKNSSRKINVSSRRPYNLDDQIVLNRWDKDIPLKWIKSYLSPEIINDLPDLSFVHLNTGDFDSELKSIKIIFEKLLKGGFIIMDIYGWRNETKKIDELDNLLELIGANSFQLITRQLVIFK